MNFLKFKVKSVNQKYVLTDTQKKNIKGGNGNIDSQDTTNIGTTDTADI